MVPLHAHSYYSLLDGYSSPLKIAKRCVELEYKACAITDHGNMFGAVEIGKALKKVGVKPIRGIELYLSAQSSKEKNSSNRKLSHLCVLAQNLKGWKELLKIVSYCNNPENFYYKPRISLKELAEFDTSNLIAFSGHPGSDLGNVCFTTNDAYRAETESGAAQYLNGFDQIESMASLYKDIFPNFFLEIQLIDRENIPAVNIIADRLRQVSKKLDIPCVATADSHYTTREEAHLQRIILCSSLQTTMKTVYNKINSSEEFGLSGFFRSNNYHIPSPSDMVGCSEAELKTSDLIADMCEEYSIQNQPLLPSMGNDDAKIRSLCANWREDRDRIENELNVITKNNLSGYFLIVADYIKWAESQGIVVGPARGSSAGSLVAHILGITKINPVKYNLIFERFYNEGRNTPGNVELPDIDTDFDKERREDVISYIKDRYGEDKVGHILTLSSLQGRGALKEVLRVYSVCGQTEMNEITKDMPNEGDISDHLEEMKKDKGYSSIIEWTLENEPKALESYCRKEGDKLVGEYAKYFEYAIQIEGVRKSAGKHASGIIISSQTISDVAPLHHQGGELICGMEMDSAKDMGLVKFDILGLSTLSKINEATRLIRCM